jgi:hypothetical protein
MDPTVRELPKAEEENSGSSIALTTRPAVTQPMKPDCKGENEEA